MSKKPRRPDPIRWFHYAYGGTLPGRYHPWVLHDLTASSRWVRQVSRTTAVLAPFVVVGLLLMGTNWIVWTAALGGFLLGVIYSLSYIDQYAEYRLTKHGFPSGTFKRVMAEAHSKATADKQRKYESRYRPTAGS
ncbi:DUF5313 family protein [Mycobacterium spongiae]|uniref:DUF5313 domain-containing protein n=1 Tax=Mycobacterium spongiae TaxID=886343 RepID=A0A975JUU5_9MYCO|nr:DUF5313 family protein [Mycobacterium spongiae]QUR65735.1 hypothetical protein F6B93_00380 [Mycobacterium spongiae]